MLRALIVHTNADVRASLREALSGDGVEVAEADSPEGAAAVDPSLDLLFVARRVAFDDAVVRLRERSRSIADLVVLDDDAPTSDAGASSLEAGVLDHVPLPADPERVLAAARRAIRRATRLREAPDDDPAPAPPRGHYDDLVGVAPSMQEVYDALSRVAPTDAPVLLIGETGTGKELAARALHRSSARSRGPFVPLHCGAIPSQLIESELFGHERGSFTGATDSHRGVFERADGGTLFLDELASMPAAAQVSLLRVVETGSLRRVGGAEPIEIDVRLVAAVDRDPHSLVRDESLREDLLYRLMVFPVRLPPLRDRQEDIDLLAEHFLDRANEEFGVERRWADEALAALRAHHWPGNVRELRNTVRRAVLGSRSKAIGPDDLALLGPGGAPRLPGAITIPVGSSIADAERKLILATLDAVDGNKRKAADHLGISVKTLYNRLRRYRAAEGGDPDPGPPGSDSDHDGGG